MKNSAKFQIHGNIGKIETLNYDDGKLVRLSVAVNETFKKGDEAKSFSHWFNCVTFSDKVINYIESYFKKGQRVLIDGKLQTKTWMKDDKKRTSTVFLIEEITSTSA